MEGVIIVTAWVTMGLVASLAVVTLTRKKNTMPVLWRCPDCKEPVTARFSEDSPRALADSVLGHVCPERFNVDALGRVYREN